MNFLKQLFTKSRSPRVCCIGLDGTPFSLLNRMLQEGKMPRLAEIASRGSLRPMSSVYPWVSSVAWTTIQTGVNPARHGIFGFIDRDPATLKSFIPLANRRRFPALWDEAGRRGKKVVVMNVPVTYPVRPVNGILTAGFLAPRLNEKAVYPPSFLPALKRRKYRIDADPEIARRDRDQALEDINDALSKRLDTFLYLLDSQPWDLFMGVIMETDRLHHFFFRQMEGGHPVYAPAFFKIYRQIDRFLGKVARRLGNKDGLVLLSDHGFCSIRKEVFYNHWLARQGWLKLSNSAQGPTRLTDLHPASVAYSLDPGRIFINLKGREKDGRVLPGSEYESVRREIIQAAESLLDPENGRPMVRKAYRREEIYDGPFLEEAADIILAPHDGYDPKGALLKDSLTGQDEMMVGMHTYDDAFVFVAGNDGQDGSTANVLDVAPTILDLLGIEPPGELEGTSLVR